MKRTAMPLPKSRVQDEGDNLPASEIDYTDNSSTKSDSTHLASSDVDNQRGKDQFDVTAVEQEEKELILKKLQELALRSEPQASSLRDGTEDSPPMHDMHLEEKASAEEQMGSKEKNDDNPCTFCQPTISQLEAEEQIQQLKDQCMMLESMSNPSKEGIDETCNNLFEEEQLDPSDAMYLMGGYDGESWLSTFSLYFPSQDGMKSSRPMSSVRSYASVVQFHKELYVFGGGNGQLWYDTVESYNPANDQWTPRPLLTTKKGSLAGATLNEKIFAIGGGNGVECFADVEMLVIDIGKWIPTRSMLQKRFALAAVELNGVIYAAGGFDGLLKDLIRGNILGAELQA